MRHIFRAWPARLGYGRAMFIVPRTPVLIIGGSAEARALAMRLQGRASVMLPAPERAPQGWPVPVAPHLLSEETLAGRIGNGVRMIVDATHPCDAASSRLIAETAARHHLPVLRLERPPWRATRRDRWTDLAREGEVARLVAPGDRVFLTTGRETLHRFAGLRKATVFVRQLSDHHMPFPLPRGRFVKGNAPFSETGEAALFRRLGIDWLVLRNAGGPGGWPKLAAARRLGLRVAMLRRPVLPMVPTVTHVAAAEERLRAWLA